MNASRVKVTVPARTKIASLTQSPSVSLVLLTVLRCLQCGIESSNGLLGAPFQGAKLKSCDASPSFAASWGSTCPAAGEVAREILRQRQGTTVAARLQEISKVLPPKPVRRQHLGEPERPILTPPLSDAAMARRSCARGIRTAQETKPAFAAPATRATVCPQIAGQTPIVLRGPASKRSPALGAMCPPSSLASTAQQAAMNAMAERPPLGCAAERMASAASPWLEALTFATLCVHSDYEQTLLR